MAVIYWFKNDLRLHDNEALLHAVNSGQEILPIFIFNESLSHKTKIGFPKMDAVRFEFAIQCVSDLRKNLKSIGGNLKIDVGNPVTILSALALKHGVTEIFMEDEFGTEEKTTLERLAKNLPSTCTLRPFWGRTLYHIDDVPYDIEDIPLTSKVFRKNTQKATSVRKTLPKIGKIELLQQDNWGVLPTLQEFCLDKAIDHHKPFVEGGETEALKRLSYYFFESEKLTSYRWTRNRSLGMDYSSKFSPYLALGCLSPRTVYEAVRKYERDIKKNQSTWWLIFEMVWRDYFTFKLMRFQDDIYQTDGYTAKTIDFENNKGLFKRWCEGRTGIPFVDAHMRQLNATGFMSNRGRVNCASFLVHDYAIDWTWGASYFESKLIDYDVGSNWMNWHAQAYQIWYTNPVHQANKYKAQEFVRKWVTELRHLDNIKTLIPWETHVANYPKPDSILTKWQRAIKSIKASSSS